MILERKISIEQFEEVNLYNFESFKKKKLEDYFDLVNPIQDEHCDVEENYGYEWNRDLRKRVYKAFKDYWSWKPKRIAEDYMNSLKRRPDSKLAIQKAHEKLNEDYGTWVDKLHSNNSINFHLENLRHGNYCEFYFILINQYPKEFWLKVSKIKDIDLELLIYNSRSIRNIRIYNNENFYINQVEEGINQEANRLFVSEHLGNLNQKNEPNNTLIENIIISDKSEHKIITANQQFNPKNPSKNENKPLQKEVSDISKVLAVWLRVKYGKNVNPKLIEPITKKDIKAYWDKNKIGTVGSFCKNWFSINGKKHNLKHLNVIVKYSLLRDDKKALKKVEELIKKAKS